MEMVEEFAHEYDSQVGSIVPLSKLGQGAAFFVAEQFKGSSSTPNFVWVVSDKQKSKDTRSCFNLYSGEIHDLKLSESVVQVDANFSVEVGDAPVSLSKYAPNVDTLLAKKLERMADEA